jgi:ACR3 family arsenite efflux pump ArsB
MTINRGDSMFRFLTLIKKNLIISILIAMVVGLIIGYYFDVSWFRSLILPLTFMLVYPMMVTLKLESIVEKWNVKLQIVTQIINFIVFPFIAYLLGILFFPDDEYLRLGLLLIGLLPTSGMTISWTAMAKGNINAAIKMVVFGLLLGALLAPFYITLFLGESISVPLGQIFTQIAVVVFLPTIAAYITQKLLIKGYGEAQFHQKIKPKFPLFTTLGVVIIIFVAIALRANTIINNPSIIIDILIPLLIMYAIFIIISIGSARLFFNREDGIALTNGTLIRALSLSLAIALSAFQEAGIAALLIAIAYTLQVQIAAWNVRLTNIFFPIK